MAAKKRRRRMKGMEFRRKVTPREFHAKLAERFLKAAEIFGEDLVQDIKTTLVVEDNDSRAGPGEAPFKVTGSLIDSIFSRTRVKPDGNVELIFGTRSTYGAMLERGTKVGWKNFAKNVQALTIEIRSDMIDARKEVGENTKVRLNVGKDQSQWFTLTHKHGRPHILARSADIPPQEPRPFIKVAFDRNKDLFKARIRAETKK